MGASNVLAAYAKYAGKVPPLSMVLLAYMAVVSRDKDTHPWFGMGHKALAEFALGRTPPINETDLKAVRRAITPLLEEGAIVVDRRAAPRSDDAKTVRYRLNLRLDVGRNSSGERRTKSGGDAGRFPAERRTESGETPDGNRPTEEYEETGGATGGRRADLRSARQGIARTRVVDDREISAMGSGSCKRCSRGLSPEGLCYSCL